MCKISVQSLFDMYFQYQFSVLIHLKTKKLRTDVRLNWDIQSPFNKVMSIFLLLVQPKSRHIFIKVLSTCLWAYLRRQFFYSLWVALNPDLKRIKQRIRWVQLDHRYMESAFFKESYLQNTSWIFLFYCFSKNCLIVANDTYLIKVWSMWLR